VTSWDWKIRVIFLPRVDAQKLFVSIIIVAANTVQFLCCTYLGPKKSAYPFDSIFLKVRSLAWAKGVREIHLLGQKRERPTVANQQRWWNDLRNIIQRLHKWKVLNVFVYQSHPVEFPQLRLKSSVWAKQSVLHLPSKWCDNILSAINAAWCQYYIE